MKCSKCGYLGFETGDRCRNCGYEFSLSTDYDLADVSITRDNAPANLDDFALVDAGAAPRAPAPTTGSFSLAAVMPPRTSARSTPAASMPLFAPGIDDDTPLITRPSPPRAPLSVRKSTPEMARLRAATANAGPKPASLDLGLDLGSMDAHTAPRVVPSDRASVPEPEAAFYYEDAGVARRLVAAVVDLAILFAIDLVVIYFTMQICGVSIAEFGILPKGPLVAFLVVQNVGYLVAFTAGGQTLGKMAAAIRVVPEDGEETIDIGCALKRTVLWLVLALPAGLGLLSALFDHDHRGLHDRFAGTRVVRATA